MVQNTNFQKLLRNVDALKACDTSCALSLHLMLTSSTLQHSFDIRFAVRAAHNLLAANWVGVCATAFAQSDHTDMLFELSD